MGWPFMPWLMYDGRKVWKQMPKLNPPPGNHIEVGAGHSLLKMLAIGESTIASIGATSLIKGLPGQLAKKLAKALQVKVSTDIIARSGLTLSKVSDLLLPQVNPTEDYDLIVVGTSGNDTFSLTPPWMFREALHYFIRQMRTLYPTTPLLFIHTPPAEEFHAFTPILRTVMGRQMRLLTKVLKEVTEGLDHSHFCADPISIATWKIKHDINESASAFFSDGIHPSELTYTVWSEDICDVILSRELLSPVKNHV